MDTSQKSKPHAAVVGGGISGLAAARKLVQQGYQVEVFEATGRLGGKIQTDTSGKMGDQVVNLGAEFVDSKEKNPFLVKLCEELGVKLIPAKDQEKQDFQLSNGIPMQEDAFFEAYEPIAARIRADKAGLLERNGSTEKWSDRALQLGPMSLDQYMQQLSGSLSTEEKALIESKIPGGLPVLLASAAHFYTSESGRDPQQISALQFVNESGMEKGSFLSSDCAFRVEGGTERIIDALKADLEKQGVEFHYNAPLAGVQKQEGKMTLRFADASTQTFDNAVLALPIKALGNIEGLEALGLPASDRKLLQEGQYTHSSKFFVKTKMDVPPATYFSGEGYQAWQSAPGMMTFLAGGEELNQKKGIALMERCMESFAKAHGTTADALFEQDPQQMVYGGPNLAKPCYASPAPGQSLGLAGLWHSFGKLAEQGLGIVGTFLPARHQDGPATEFSVGFMESGLNSAEYMVGKLATRQQQAEQQVQPQSNFVDRATLRPATGYSASI